MGKRAWTGLAVVAALLAGAPQALAATPTSCATLATDMNAATAGEVLQLPPGACSTNVDLTNKAAFTLEGAAGGGTVLEPTVASDPIIDASDGTPAKFTLSGLTFTGMGGAAAVLVQDPGEAVTITGDAFGNNSYPSGFGAAVSIQTQGGAGTIATQPTVISKNSFSRNDAPGAGAVTLLGSNPITLSGNTFTANGAEQGGAVTIDGASHASTNAVLITGNTFGGSSTAAGNTATDEGGAVDLLPGPGQPVTISHNTFEDNAVTGTADFDREGGGLWIDGQDDTTGAITQSHNVFAGNVINATAGEPDLHASGGAEFLLGATLYSTADVFVDNRVASDDSIEPWGGAVGVSVSAGPTEPGDFIGADDLFEGNSTAAGGWGGAIYTGAPPSICSSNCPPSGLTLDDSTVIGNRVDQGAGSQGGAIWGSPHDDLTVHNSIVYGNTPQPEIFGYASKPPVVTFSDACSEAGGPAITTGSGNICKNPLLGGSGVETAASPTIDAGSNALVPAGLTTDLLGNPRIRANRLPCSGLGPAIVDMGAYEFTGIASPSCPAPKVAIGNGPLVDRGGIVRVKLTCPKGQVYCDGTVTLTYRGRTLGKVHFHIAGGHHKTVRVKLSRKARRRLAKVKGAKVKALVTATDHNAAGLKARTKRKLTLRRQKRN